MRRLFLDPSVLLLAVGGDHPLRTPCRRVLQTAASHRASLHLSVEGGQEFLFHRLRRVEVTQAVREFDRLDRIVVWHPFDHEILLRSRDLVAGGHARGRDAVHAATAIMAAFDEIVSCDRHLDGIPGLRRIDPAAGDVG